MPIGLILGAIGKGAKAIFKKKEGGTKAGNALRTLFGKKLPDGTQGVSELANNTPPLDDIKGEPNYKKFIIIGVLGMFFILVLSMVGGRRG